MLLHQRSILLTTVVLSIVAVTIGFFTTTSSTATSSWPSSIPWSSFADLAVLHRAGGRAIKSLTQVKKYVTFLTTSSAATITTTTTTTTRTSVANMTTRKTPVYFVSHGGPTTMYETNHPVYPKLQSLGREITHTVKPDAIVVFSAHWQSDLPDGIEVNTSEEEPLLYDFYGFPKHYYQAKFPNTGSKKVAERVLDLLHEAGIKARGTDRGLDHGVFVPFSVMFEPDKNPVGVPIVQVSLFDDDNANTAAARHVRLGEAVQKLREENVVIIVSGMAVHNLRHFRMVMGSGQTMPYAVSFDDALKVAVEKEPGNVRNEAMEELLKRTDARQAHPTFEHLLPIHIGVGAAGHDVGKQVWTLPEGSMSWAQYRFGTV